jgi:hypothetical protein
VNTRVYYAVRHPGLCYLNPGRLSRVLVPHTAQTTIEFHGKWSFGAIKRNKANRNPYSVGRALGNGERVFGRRWLRFLLIPHRTRVSARARSRATTACCGANCRDPALHKLVVVNGGGEQEVVVQPELDSLLTV